jgi:L-fuconate dehydratase
MALGAVLNAAWDLRCRREGKPLWRLLSELTPEEIVDLVDFRYLTDVLDRDRALELLRAARAGREEREQTLLRDGFPAYTTAPGWLGYDDAKLARLCREAVADGFDHVKLKVGADLDDDRRRLEIARSVVGRDVTVSVDANQRWEVAEAVAWMRELAPLDPYWIEEPTSPDDVLGHRAVREGVAPIRVATGEHVHNRVVFKQLLAAGAIDVCQIDATRVGGVNENLAILLLAAHHGVPVVPHAGGVGLCEVVQHLAMFDYVALGSPMEGRWIEYVDHLHEHFEEPVRLRRARYLPPTAPGTGARILDRSLDAHVYPHGPVWAESEGARS